MVEHVDQYPWSSHSLYASQTQSSFVDTSFVLKLMREQFDSVDCHFNQDSLLDIDEVYRAIIDTESYTPLNF